MHRHPRETLCGGIYLTVFIDGCSLILNKSASKTILSSDHFLTSFTALVLNAIDRSLEKPSLGSEQMKIH